MTASNMRGALPLADANRAADQRGALVGPALLPGAASAAPGAPAMNRPAPARPRRTLRCAIYTRKSTEEGLEQEFNSLHAQREACEAFIRSQRHEGWTVLPERYDDGGYSGGTMDRPALQQLLADIAPGRIDLLVTYKIDRLTPARPPPRY